MVVMGVMTRVIGAGGKGRRTRVVRVLRIEVSGIGRVCVCGRHGCRKSMRMSMSIWSITGGS